MSNALRRFLYFTAGVAGAAVMIIEILGAKILAPYLGTSHYVWTAQIAVTLVSLAGGYYLGGRREGVALAQVPEALRRELQLRRHAGLGELDEREPVVPERFLSTEHYDPLTKTAGDYFVPSVYALARAYSQDSPKDVLAVGMGVGMGPMYFAKHGATVEIVEINPAVVPLAARFFDFAPERFSIHIQDGRVFLQHATRRYDCVVLDVFLSGGTLPSHLMTRETFQAIRNVLTKTGVLIINTNVFRESSDFRTSSLYKTLGAAFADVVIHDSGVWNLFLVASPSKLNARTLPLADDIPPWFATLVARVMSNSRRPDGGSGRVLTDDYNPTEFYAADQQWRLHRALVQTFDAD